MAAGLALNGFALGNGEYVYTPQGRFLITGDNLNANSSFATWNGWTVVSAAGDKTIDAAFVTNANGYADGINSVMSTDAATTEGMYYKFTPSSASGTYVVSYKMKGSFAETTRIKTNALSTNLVKVEGNADNVYGGETEVVIANTAEELTENWQTFNYAIVGDGTARTYFISFTGMATDIEIADLQIAPAQQYADLRQRDAMVERYEAYINCYKWDAALLSEWGLTETLEELKAIGDESSQDELEGLLEGANATLAEFLKETMDDYLAGNNTNYFNIDKWPGKIQKAKYLGDWLCFPHDPDPANTGRGFWENEGTYPDLGHYQKGPGWCYGDVTAPMGVSTQMELVPGSYVFAIEANAAFRENASQSWDNDDAMKPAYAVAYIAKVVGDKVDTLVSVVKGLEPVNFTPFIVSATADEKATYEFGLKAYCKEPYQALSLGSVAYVKDASIWSKNTSPYKRAQLVYEQNVRTQIATGRDNLTTAKGYIADNEMYWGKAALQDTINMVEPLIANYEAMSQDAIIATYADYYENTTANDNGLLQFEVYDTAVKHIIAANRTFVAVNAILNSLQAGIDNAEEALAMRLYESSTGKAALEAEIEAVKGAQAWLQDADYSEENAAIIQESFGKLSAAIEVFKNSLPASAIATIVDIDFEQAATLNAETGLYSVTGAAGTMEFSSFTQNGDVASIPFEQGYWSNGEQLWKGYVRVGNGTGTVNFDPTDNGSMGTNILKVNFTFYLQGLSGRYLGVYLKDETGENNVAGFFANYYDSKIGDGADDNTFGIAQGNLQYGSGGNYNNVAPEGAEGAGTYTCAKNSFEFIFDFGEGSMYCTTTSAKGVFTTEKKAFDGTIPYSFVLQCNYNNSDRRVWFDDLKIQRITAGPADGFVDGVKEVNTAEQTVAPVKKVLKDGRIVINGKYGLNGIVIK